ncbi:SURF1 family protein [Pimelobacter simplex]|uniref:SURF1-like protein n=1 Tax=Nocardioides simplex TaxID=2045 RepID=A0A7J5E4E4_NOCSI|nr:SURF1 family protein [Pimelobacter simplex]KAB2813118.1 SURF1 family protein [Pimelobacter simplex]
MVRWWSVRMWGAHLLGLLCVSIAVGMGVWQYDAWQTRRAAERVDLTKSDPVPITKVIGPDDPFPTAGLGRPVDVRGTFLPGGTVLVADRPSDDGRSGAWLVTPLTVGDAAAPAVPVVRGWVPDGTDPASLPAPPAGEVAVLGWLQPPESSGPVDDDPNDDVLPVLRIADLVQRVDQDLYGAYVIAEEPLPSDAAAGVDHATLDQLPQASRFTALRNILYAIEWWVFAAFAAFIWFRYVRDATAEPDLEEADAEDAGDDAVPSKP